MDLQQAWKDSSWSWGLGLYELLPWPLPATPCPTSERGPDAVGREAGGGCLPPWAVPLVARGQV